MAASRERGSRARIELMRSQCAFDESPVYSLWIGFAFVIGMASTGCGGSGAPACNVDSDCGDETICVSQPNAESGDAGMSTGRCMRECDLGASRICSDGTVCLEVEMRGVCWAGGPTSIRKSCRAADCSCAADTDCEPGGLCIEGSCLQACERNPDVVGPERCHPFCDYKEACVSHDGTLGYCGLAQSDAPPEPCSD